MDTRCSHVKRAWHGRRCVRLATRVANTRYSTRRKRLETTGWVSAMLLETVAPPGPRAGREWGRGERAWSGVQDAKSGSSIEHGGKKIVPN